METSRARHHQTLDRDCDASSIWTGSDLDDLGLEITLPELCKQGSDLAPVIVFDFKSGAVPEVVLN